MAPSTASSAAALSTGGTILKAGSNLGSHTTLRTPTRGCQKVSPASSRPRASLGAVAARYPDGALMPSRRRARLLRSDRPVFVYDGRDLYARIVFQADGWHAVLEASGAVLGPFPTCASAILFCNARKAHTPAAPIAGERAADANHAKKIRTRQRQACEQRARRVGSAR